MEAVNPTSVLIVDDDENICALLQRILEAAGHSCKKATTGEKALDILAQESFAVVLCDINLPGLSGLEMLSRGRQRPEPPAFVMVTALRDREVAVNALNKGACGYIVKPFSSDEVLIQIEVALHLRTMELENCHIQQNLEELVNERTAELSLLIAEQRETEKSLLATLEKLKISETANRINLTHLQTIIQSIPYPFYVVDVSNYSLLMANIAASPDGAWLGKTCHALTHHQDTPCNSDKHACPLQEVVATGKPVLVEHLHARGDGSEAYYEVHGYPLFDEKGKVIQLIEFSIDINDRKKAERVLKENEQRLKDILDGVQTGVMIIDPATHRIVEINPAACRMFMSERHTVTGQLCHRFICPAEEGQCPVTDLGRQVDNSERVLLTKNGGKLPILKTVTQISLGGSPYLLESFVDISGQKAAEEQLKKALGESQRLAAELEHAYSDLKTSQAKILQQEKMATIGQLAAGVAHEINNPMGFITSNLNTLVKYLDKLTGFINRQQEVVHLLGADSELAKTLHEERKKLKIDIILEDLPYLIDESLDGASRVRTIVQNLKNFSRVNETAMTMADLNECIETTLTIVWNELKYKATVEKEYGNLPLTYCNPHQLNQVFMNLLVNAAQAIEKKGKIKITTAVEGNWIKTTITDDGTGMTQETSRHIFDPFFTTKEIGKGTGLGLSIVYDIVKAHNGDISVASKMGEGTTFTVTIPIVESDITSEQ
ncbi:MAG: response regulator [Desulfobulbaceae bacterium]|nr:response regulator [Desulfobulbaceae bacterium]